MRRKQIEGKQRVEVTRGGTNLIEIKSKFSKYIMKIDSPTNQKEAKYRGK